MKIPKILFRVILGLPMLVLAQPQPTWFDKAFGAFGRSEPVYLFSKYGAAPIERLVRSKGKPVSPELQKLWEEIQDVHGIPKRKQLPLYHTSSPTKNIAQARADAVYLGSDWDTFSYAEQKTTLFHEATHVKYGDRGSSLLIALFTVPLLCYATDSLLEKTLFDNRGDNTNLSNTKMALTGLFTLVNSYAISKLLNRYQEKRADTEAAYLSACAQCVREKSFIKSDTENETDKDGYLSKKSWIKISDELVKEGKYCAHHKNAPRIKSHGFWYSSRLLS